MVSLDPPERNREFADSLGAGFPVLSDPDGKAARAYGVLAPGGGVASSTKAPVRVASGVHCQGGSSPGRAPGPG
jgi:peroxiredoxin